MTCSDTLDHINRRTYGRRSTVRHYVAASGWLEAGEQAAVGHVAALHGDEPVLDIGMGGGRTAPLLLAVSRDYVGIDYMPQMVAASRTRFPGIDFREMDARALSFADARFSWVNFSYNGIDSVSRKDRGLILAQVRRVLRDDGHFVFSSLNIDGPLARPSPARDLVARLRAPARRRRSAARAFAIFVVSSWNRLRNRRLAAAPDAGGALINIAAHANGLVATFVSSAAQQAELEAAGFIVEAVYRSADGMPLAPGQSCTRSDCFYYVARKVPARG